MRAWLKAYAPSSHDAPLFPSARGHGIRLTKDGAERLVAAAAKRAGIPKRVYPHLLRHSRATHLLRIGVPEAQVKQLLGWKPNSPMLGVYSHLVNRDAYAALLRAHGLEPPEAPENGALVASEGELRPVVPLVRAPPGPRADALPAGTVEGDVDGMVRDMLKECGLSASELMAVFRVGVKVLERAKGATS